MSIEKGEVSILHLKVDGVYVPFGCLTSNGFNESVEIKDTTTRASNGWGTGIPTTQEYNIVFEGLQKLNDDSIVTYDDIKALKRNRSRIEWGESFKGTIVDEGYGYFTEISKNAVVGEFISYSGTIIGYSEPVVVTIEGDLFQDGSVMLFQDGNEMIFQ